MGQIKNIKLHIVTDIKAHLQPETTQHKILTGSLQSLQVQQQQWLNNFLFVGR